MIGYVTIGARDTAEGTAFYDAVLGTIGYKRFAEFGTFTGYGIGGKSDGQSIWICSHSTARTRAPATASWWRSTPQTARRSTRSTKPR
jgi:catechol 2,3-dioxygenase-like lactoylglutathione lyase family enzyme